MEVLDWDWGSWSCFGCFSLMIISLSFKFEKKSVMFKGVRDPPEEWYTLLEFRRMWRFLTGSLMTFWIWGWGSWWRFWWFQYGLVVTHTKSQLSTLSLKASRTPLEIDDIAGGLEDTEASWLGLMFLTTTLVCFFDLRKLKFQFWLNSVESKLSYSMK